MGVTLRNTRCGSTPTTPATRRPRVHPGNKCGDKKGMNFKEKILSKEWLKRCAFHTIAVYGDTNEEYLGLSASCRLLRKIGIRSSEVGEAHELKPSTIKLAKWRKAWLKALLLLLLLLLLCRLWPYPAGSRSSRCRCRRWSWSRSGRTCSIQQWSRY